MKALAVIGLIIGFTGTILIFCFLFLPGNKGEHLFWGVVCIIIGAFMMAKGFEDDPN